MEKHEHIHLYLDHDDAGKKCLEIALKRSSKYEDESRLYEGYKDINDWVTHFGMLIRKQSLKRFLRWDCHKLFRVASYVSVKPKRWLFSCRSCGIQKMKR